MKIFSISGLRGQIGEGLDTKTITSSTLAFANFIKSGRCAIGRDTRNSSDYVYNAAIAGLSYGGCHVIDLGEISTPGIFRYVKNKKLEGGVCVTASHNPPDWNGLKFIVNPGRGINKTELNGIKNSEKTYNKNCKMTTDNSNYVTDLINLFRKNNTKQLKISIDTNGGAGSLFVENLFKELGHEVISINNIPGKFKRKINPVEDNLEELTNSIIENNADVGFAFDADVDRLVILDNNGEKLPADYTLIGGIKYIKQFLEIKRAAISVDSTKAIKDLLEIEKIECFETGVGEINVVTKILEKECQLGGEGSSGGLIYPEFNICRDGVLASLMITSLIAEHGQIKEVFQDVKKYHQIRSNMEIPIQEHNDIIEKLKIKYNNYSDIDGIKIIFNRDSWGLIRGSNTENVLRISVEDKTLEDTEKVFNILKRDIKNITKT